jgi:hypothetical protein
MTHCLSSLYTQESQLIYFRMSFCLNIYFSELFEEYPKKIDVNLMQLSCYVKVKKILKKDLYNF